MDDLLKRWGPALLLGVALVFGAATVAGDQARQEQPAPVAPPASVSADELEVILDAAVQALSRPLPPDATPEQRGQVDAARELVERIEEGDVIVTPPSTTEVPTTSTTRPPPTTTTEPPGPIPGVDVPWPSFAEPGYERQYNFPPQPSTTPTTTSGP